MKKHKQRSSNLPTLIMANLLPLLVMLGIAIAIATGKLSISKEAEPALKNIFIFFVLFFLMGFFAWICIPITLKSISKLHHYLKDTQSRSVVSLPLYITSVVLYPLLVANLIALILLTLICIGGLVFYAVITLGGLF